MFRALSIASVRILSSGLALAAAIPPALASTRDLYVTSDANNVVRRYDGVTGALVTNFFGSNAAVGQLGIHFGATNNRVLVGHFSGGVEEFDATTGGYIKTYNAGGGTQWAGLYGPNGNVLIGDWNTNDVREYDATTGAFVGVLTPVTVPADMRIGPNGNLFICSFSGGFVLEVNASNGAFVSQWSQPAGAQTNDIAFPPSGEILVTAMQTNTAYRYDSAHNLVGTFTGTGWGRPHGIDVSPWTGNILVVDGVTAQVHEFDPTTYVELDPAFLSPPPIEKIVDLEFFPNVPRVVCVNKDLYNSTGSTVDGVQIVVEGTYPPGILGTFDGGFPNFTTFVAGPYTTFAWSGLPTGPGTVRHVGLCLNADVLHIVGVYWTAGGSQAGCAPQCNSLYGTHSGGTGVLMYSNKIPCGPPHDLFVGNLQVEYYGANPPALAEMVVGGNRSPMHVDSVPGLVTIPAEGVVVAPTPPAPPAGAEFSLLVFDVGSDPALSTATGDFVLTRLERDIPDSPMTTICEPGVGGVISCPCGNPPTGPGRGCNNFGAGPAQSGGLTATGIASLTFDNVVLHASGENNSSLTVFWTGSGASPTGFVHGAGVRCVTSALRRLYTGAASGGAVSRPGSGDPSVSLRSAAVGSQIQAGATRYYFAIYRDPNAAGPCGVSAATINLTSAGAIVWDP